MQKLYLSPTSTSPEINFSPEEDIFIIRGTSSPEDVRALYYPVIEWVSNFINEILDANPKPYNSEKPLRFQIDMNYFNSSSAKFFYDIFHDLKRLINIGIPVIIEWCHEEEDIDLKEAGADIALLVNMEFEFISKKT